MQLSQLCCVRNCFCKCIRFFQTALFSTCEEFIERKKYPNTALSALDACSKEAQQSTKRGISRRGLFRPAQA